ncbi:hypothetical protein [Sphingomonas morindae]|uniref:Uncharacterized protein n=1 Tax=Sphingomonas morindae TaxID=1541170 RepID=A0ABY4X3R4_9SPHN|nr:hypothetical protein [Sphingomonas morindae]USI71558.1 hypothetical protein LHA26_09420 [Sphingomonas morindae]
MIDVPDVRQFRIHDVTRFPIVEVRPGAVRPGYGADWIREMEQLISGSTAFVLLYSQAQHTEEHEDFKLRGIWMKANKARLSTLCTAVIWVEADEGKRAALRAQSLGAQRAFGVPIKACATKDEAVNRGWELLFGRNEETDGSAPNGTERGMKAGHVR